MSAVAAANQRRSHNSPARYGVRWRRLGIGAGAFLLISLVAAAVLMLIPATLDWSTRTLGLAWIPVGLVAAITLLGLVYSPGGLLRRWRWWMAAVVVTTAAVGSMSFMQGQQGALYVYGLSGQWGYALTNGNMTLAVAELIAGLIAVSLLLIPNCWRFYRSAARFLGRHLWNGVLIALTAMGKLSVVATRFAIRTARVAARATASLASRGGRLTPEPAADVPLRPAGITASDVPDVEPTETAPAPVAIANSSNRHGWQLPPIELLAPSEPHQIDQRAIAVMSDEIKDALAEHGVFVDVEDVKAGPRVVRFGLVPGYIPSKSSRNDGGAPQRPSRVRVGDISKRQKDLALALKSPYIRIIESPEPGEGLVGLEVPNPSPGKVLMRTLVEGQEFNRIVQKGGLAFALGEDAGGQPLALDLAAMPHVLIAGATGSGKSVCINSLVASLLITRPPDELRMIMVDPKRVELTPFNGIPHLVTPVIVEPDEVQPVLRGLIQEMTRRYKLMEEIGVRNIAGYNGKADEPMPFLVLIVDELADLMMTGGLEVEQQLVRLAQLGRAAGIHMVLATQRPSVKVVTGLLKANVPARVAFAVASQVDSRVILDSSGAETLMGKGDLLLMNNDFPKPRRGQGTLVYDDETDRLIEFWRNQKGPPLPRIDLDISDNDAETAAESGRDDADDIYEGDVLQQARDLALRNPRLNSVILERRLKIRKSLADELIDELRGEGLVIGGSSAR